MKRKIQKIYQDKGFGFPVTLMNVPMIDVRGEWVPEINQTQLQRIVIKCLAAKKGRLTGNEVRFIRLFMDIGLQAFAKHFDISHPAVIKWEKAGNQLTGMNWTTEKDLRLLAFFETEPTNDAFMEVYQQLLSVAPERTEGLKIDLQKKTA